MWTGIIQGSILGPILYAIFISPLFDIENLTCYADDKFPLVQGKNRLELVAKMQLKLENIIAWLTKSGMVVNRAKTDLCLFCRYDVPPLVINIGGQFVISKKAINILGVSFDSKLQWADQVALACSKATKAINAIRLIKRFFTKPELLQLITANVFSVLYYNSEIWHIPTLKNELKTKLTSISAKAIKMCMYYPCNMISHKDIHKMNNRAMPDTFMKYKIAIQLYRLYNLTTPTHDWTVLNFDQILTSRQTKFAIAKSNKQRVGMNILTNQFFELNGLIPIMWLNYSYETFKINIKKLLL